jgi:hypothetical protein
VADKVAGYIPFSNELAEDARVYRLILDRTLTDAFNAMRFGESREHAMDLIERGTSLLDWLDEDDCGDVSLETVAW